MYYFGLSPGSPVIPAIIIIIIIPWNSGVSESLFRGDKFTRRSIPQSSLLSYPETQGLEYYSMVKIHRRTSPSIIHVEYAQRWYSFRCANLCPFRGE
jgi:hypothetical protein